MIPRYTDIPASMLTALPEPRPITSRIAWHAVRSWIGGLNGTDAGALLPTSKSGAADASAQPRSSEPTGDQVVFRANRFLAVEPSVPAQREVAMGGVPEVFDERVVHHSAADREGCAANVLFALADRARFQHGRSTWFPLISPVREGFRQSVSVSWPVGDTKLRHRPLAALKHHPADKRRPVRRHTHVRVDFFGARRNDVQVHDDWSLLPLPGRQGGCGDGTGPCSFNH